MTTNEQWLKSLDTEELAEYITAGNTCHIAMSKNCDNYIRCSDCKIAWLKQERGE